MSQSAIAVDVRDGGSAVTKSKSFIEEMLDCDDKLKQDAELLLVQTRATLAELIQKIMRDDHTVKLATTTIVASEKLENRLHWPSGLSNLCASYLGTMSLRWDFNVDEHFNHTVTSPDFYRRLNDSDDAVKFVALFDFPANLNDRANKREINIDEYVAFEHSETLLPTFRLHQISKRSPHSAIFKLLDNYFARYTDFEQMGPLITVSKPKKGSFKHFFNLNETGSALTTNGEIIFDQEPNERVKISKIEVEFSRTIARGTYLFSQQVDNPLIVPVSSPSLFKNVCRDFKK